MAFGCLSLCATPIGNLGDVSLRVLECLRTAETIYAEDTRVTRKLLAAYDIHVPLERADQRSLPELAPQVAERVAAGAQLAFVSDAGMPGVSDPGQALVAALRQAGLPVAVLPGASAFTCAYVASGTAAPHLYFGGFLPRADQAFLAELERLRPLLADGQTALAFYESPRRILHSLELVERALGKRPLCLCRELTKLHEQVLNGSAHQVATALRRSFGLVAVAGAAEAELARLSAKQREKHLHRQARAEAAAIKGEMVLLVLPDE
jgi:16S rRNA (cytidine1402-2'-O)-methyltransferase